MPQLWIKWWYSFHEEPERVLEQFQYNVKIVLQDFNAEVGKWIF
jgi:hypothetical protein